MNQTSALVEMSSIAARLATLLRKSVLSDRVGDIEKSEEYRKQAKKLLIELKKLV